MGKRALAQDLRGCPFDLKGVGARSKLYLPMPCDPEGQLLSRAQIEIFPFPPALQL